MNVFSNLRAARDTVYNKVWRAPKGKLSSGLRNLCDGLSHKQRLMVVSVMLCAFVLIAFFVNLEHIQPLEIHKPDVKPITTVAYDDAGMESED